MNRTVLLMLVLPTFVLAQESRAPNPAVLAPGWADDPPMPSSLVEFAQHESTLRTAVLRYARDVEALHRRYPVDYSPARIERMRKLAEGWQQQLAKLDYSTLNFEGEIDYIALRNHIDYDLERLRLEEQRAAQLAPLLPFFDDIRLLQEQRFDRKRVDPKAAAATLDRLTRQAKELTASLREPRPANAKERSRDARPRLPGGAIAIRAQAQLDELRETLKDWHTFYDGYDPNYTWWARKPYGEADAALKEYGEAIRGELLGIKPGGKAPILGDPVLADGLRSDLAVEMIPYEPRELIAIGEQEFEWIDEQLRATSRRMGYGDDWKAALEHTKNLAPAPGEAPAAIYDIADYSEDFIAKQHSITLAPLAREIWRLEMQTPEKQLINPFFTGGEVTRLSYPTDSMSYDDRLMSQRGNTPHFNFPTVQHELVPGHHYQGWMNERFNSHRDLAFDTPFWREGWALYWELRLWDASFPRNDPDRMGMLFWRAHRAARIIFSMHFQLGNWSAQQCVDFLVERVGHERANAEAEVRRSAQAAPPLYQAAYLLGGLQLRALYKEMVDSGRMTATDFHDAVLSGGPMPIELVRARLLGKPIGKDYRSQWRFYGDPRRR
ncbi:MAG TPA: DUF885 family protein [Steroidobacteraceae bacterium]|nr:DUF885 family protein [Steroidobacteraceae bacterium]